MHNVECHTSLTDQQKEAVLAIWNAEYPKQLQIFDKAAFDSFLLSLISPEYYLFKNSGAAIFGWAAVFYRDRMRNFFIMLSGSSQGKGYGTTLLNALKGKENSLFGWVIDHGNDVKANGTPYLSPINFYEENGFMINHGLRLENNMLSAVNVVWNANATS
jgi:GNAT superfamily N-acetyltransferase